MNEIIREIINKIVDAGYEAYIVGGYVRDYLLGLKTNDIDIATNASVDNLTKIFGEMGTPNPKYCSYHILKDDYRFDITSYRKELEYKKNKPIKIVPAKDLKTDLLRRDFTINTFAMDKNGKFVDLLDSKVDLQNNIIRVVGDTYEKLSEDKTRIIRAIRFSCTLNFELDDNIKEFLKEHGSMLNEIPREYIKKELDKIFDSDGYSKFFYLAKVYKLEKYLSIKFDNVKAAYNRIGVWAQIETLLPLSNAEKKDIDCIKYLVGSHALTLSNMFLYNDNIVKNAGCILNMDRDVKEFYEIKNMHSIIDIDMDYEALFRYVPIVDIRRVYKKIEREILEGNLSNNKFAIERYIRNREYDRF